VQLGGDASYGAAFSDEVHNPIDCHPCAFHFRPTATINNASSHCYTLLIDMQVMETLHPACLILPFPDIAETTPMTRTGGSGALCSGGEAGFERPDRIGVAVSAIPPITLPSASGVAEYEVVFVSSSSLLA
jgi:hypothetical protein